MRHFLGGVPVNRLLPNHAAENHQIVGYLNCFPITSGLEVRRLPTMARKVDDQEKPSNKERAGYKLFDQQ